MRSLKTLSVISAVALFACQGPLPKNDFVWSSPSEKLIAATPVDIAVMTPRDNTKRSSILPGIAPNALPIKDLRKRCYDELIQRRYTPLSMEFVDRAFLGKAAASEASFSEVRERCGADAILEVTINRWDNSHLESAKIFSIGAEAFLKDAKTGEILWQAKADRDINLEFERDIDRAGSDELRERALDKFFHKLFAQLPIREIPKQN